MTCTAAIPWHWRNDSFEITKHGTKGAVSECAMLLYDVETLFPWRVQACKEFSRRGNVMSYGAMDIAHLDHDLWPIRYYPNI